MPPHIGKLSALLLMAGLCTAASAQAPAPDTATNTATGTIYNAAHKAIGTISLTETASGVLLRVDAHGLPAGWHGMHFHEKGDCSDAAFKDAGAHVHMQTPVVHGFMMQGENDAGDLPNLYVDAKGKAMVELHSTLASLHGEGGRPALLDADASALVIHAKPDDYTTQPIGGSGDRIACAVIH
ncbi:superoxide dismutase family protein [Novosphingobium sp. 9]|uniref:superoxide dismutase family protein n=1 Tax=Novosphingobium sp. 9 TaxID=2025349 RepID=UPI0021B51F16|nr:superoxide dismutase family protein [Novosphingobium sp. 9]